MRIPIGLDLRPSSRTGLGTPGLGGMVVVAAGTAAVVAGLSRRSAPGIALALAGGELAYRGLTGMSLGERLAVATVSTGDRVRLSLSTRPPDSDVLWSAVTINREREPVYAFWRDLAGLTRLDAPDLPWTVTEMRLEEERPLEHLEWVADAEDGNGRGEVLRLRVDLRDAPKGRATEVILTVRLPGGPGPFGVRNRLVGPIAQIALDELARRARQLLETGEVATTEGQPSGREAPSHEAPARDAYEARAQDAFQDAYEAPA